MQPGEIVRAFLAALSDGDVERAMTYCDPDIVLEMPASRPARTEGVRKLASDLELVIGPAVRVDWRVLTQVEDGELVMNERLDRSEYPDGTSFAVPIGALWRVRNGRIVLWRDHFDGRGVEEQLGTDWRSFAEKLKRWQRQSDSATSGAATSGHDGASPPSLRVGLVYPQSELGGDPAAIGRMATLAEDLGYDHILVYDHPLGAHPEREPASHFPYTHQDPFHDPLAMFAYLAGITRDVELCTGVLVLPQRQTGLVARQATDVDLLSRGRLRLGVGVGWNEYEYRALGQDFGRRGRRLDEQIPVLRQLWSEPLVEADCGDEHFDRVAVIPRPTRRIPIWIGGFGGAARRRAVRLGDGFIFSGALEKCLPAWEDLRAQLEDAGRDPATFGAEFIARGDKSPSQLVDELSTWHDAGGTHGSVASLHRGFTTIDEHVELFAALAAALDLTPRPAVSPSTIVGSPT